MTAEWFYAKDKEKVGPVTEAQLMELCRSGEISRPDMVWRQGMAKWQRAGEVEGLFVRTSAPPPLPEAGTEAPALAESPAVRSPDELKLPVVGMFVVCGLALLTGLVGMLNADHPVVRILLALGVAHNLAAVALAVNVARLRNYGLASVAPWLVMTCWAWHWFTDVTHGMTLLGMVVAASAGVWALAVMRGKDVRRAFDADPPLPPLFFAGRPTALYDLDPGTRFPWPVEERSASNPKLLWLKVAIGASIVVGFLFLLSIVGAIFCLPFFSLASLIYVMAVRTSRLHGRWVPVEGQAGWIEFVSGGIYKREDGTVGTFAVLPNQRFVDILVSGHLVDSWRILAWGVDTLEVQDMAGKPRSFKKGKTLEEKQASLFHSERKEFLPGSWVPTDGSGRWVQFTQDGAVVYSDGEAGRYTVIGEEPNEVVRVEMADGSARSYRVMSLTESQLVIVEGKQAITYNRHSRTNSAASGTSGEDGESPERAPKEQKAGTSVGGVLSGLWNWLTKWQCPACRSRNTEVRGSEITERTQEVMTDFSQGSAGHHPQAVFNVHTHQHDCRCKDCGHEWIQQEKTRFKA